MTITLKNANKEILEICKNLCAIQHGLKVECIKEKKPNNELIKTIKEVRRGEVVRCGSFEEFKKEMLK